MNIKSFYRKYSRSLKYGSNAVILTAIVVALAVFLNMLVGLINVKWDLTPNKVFSVSNTTRDIIKELDRNVEIISLNDDATLQNNADFKKVVEILEHYKSDKIKITYTDPDKDLSVISNLDPDGLHKIKKTDFVVKCGNKMKVINIQNLLVQESNYYTGEVTVKGLNAEQIFSGAIKYVTADVTPIIYFLTGHEEKTVDDGFSFVKNYIIQNNYDIKTLNLMTEGKIPDDCEVLVVIQPQRDLAPVEREILKDYMKYGAKIIFMFDPVSKEEKFTNFDSILLDYNISLGYDQITENDSNYYLPGNQQILYLPFQTNSILPIQYSADGKVTMPMSRSINILKNVKEYLTTSAIIKTSDKAKSKTVDGEELSGPFNTAVLAEYTGGYTPTKLLVIGNSVFASDSFMNPNTTYYNPYGGIFFVYSLNYMQDKKDDQVVIPSKKYETRAIDISQSTANALGISVVVVYPLIILGLGVAVWLKRRHL